MRHALPYPRTVPPENPDDPDLMNVFVDLDLWLALHPCGCEALCECDDDLRSEE